LARPRDSIGTARNAPSCPGSIFRRAVRPALVKEYGSCGMCIRRRWHRVDIPHRNNGTPCRSTCPRSKQTSSCLSMPIQIASIMARIQTWPYYVLVDQLSEPSMVERVSSFPQASQVGGGSELDDIRYAMAATSRRRRGGQRDSEEAERFGRHHPRPSVDQRHVYAKC